VIPASLTAWRYWLAFKRPKSMEVGPVSFVAALAAGIESGLSLVEFVNFLRRNDWLGNWFAVNAILTLDFAKSLTVDFGWYTVAWRALAVFALASMFFHDVNASQKYGDRTKNENHQLVDLVGHLLSLNDCGVQNRRGRIAKRTESKSTVACPRFQE